MTCMKVIIPKRSNKVGYSKYQARYHSKERPETDFCYETFDDDSQSIPFCN